MLWKLLHYTSMIITFSKRKAFPFYFKVVSSDICWLHRRQFEKLAAETLLQKIQSLLGAVGNLNSHIVSCVQLMKHKATRLSSLDLVSNLAPSLCFPWCGTLYVGLSKKVSGYAIFFWFPSPGSQHWYLIELICCFLSITRTRRSWVISQLNASKH